MTLAEMNKLITALEKDVSEYRGYKPFDKYLGPCVGPYLGKRTKAKFFACWEIAKKYNPEFETSSQFIVNYLMCEDLTEQEKKLSLKELHKRLTQEGWITEDVVAESYQLLAERLNNEKAPR